MASSSQSAIQQQITQTAISQGVPPEIALGVAQTESGFQQFTAGGAVITSSAGALGIFQLMPSTAAGLGVNPLDTTENISGGITYLKQLYDKYGNWSDALAAYNWGPGNVDSGSSVPTSVTGYVTGVLANAANWAAQLFGISSSPAAPPTIDAATGLVISSPDVTESDLTANVLGFSAGTVAIVATAVIAAIAFLFRD